MAAQNAVALVVFDDHVLHVDVIDAVREAADELDRVHALPVQMAGIEVKAEFGPPVEGFQARSAVYRSKAISVGWTSSAST